MLINFVGGPGSCKTTVASILFSDIKQAGMNAEFVSEYARTYIAALKVVNGITFPKTNKIALNDEDQMAIMENQFNTEQNFCLVTDPKNTLVISDSSPLNTIFYLSKETRNSAKVKNIIKLTNSLNPLIFFCRPVLETLYPKNDLNRIHTYKQSLEIDTAIQQDLLQYCPNLRIIELTGPTKEKARKAFVETIKAL